MRYRKRIRSKPTRNGGLHIPRLEALENRFLLASDMFESNNSFDRATDLGTGDQAYQELSISPSGDKDYFQWTAAQDGILSVDILFRHSRGDLDLELFNSDGARVARSDTLSDNEHIDHEVFAGQSFFIRVIGWGGSTNTYDMLIDGPEATISPDGFEPNQTFADASDVGIGDQIHGGLTIHSVFDEDWYEWTATLNGILNVSALFSDANGNIDLELYESDGTLIDSSTSNTDTEQVITTVTGGETYVIHIFTPGFDNQEDYTLIIDGPEDGVPVDEFEPNDTFGQAADIGSGDQTFLGLTIHEPNNDDWYQWMAPANGEVTIETFFSHAVADLDLEVYDANQNLIGASRSSGNTERVAISASAGDVLYVLAHQPEVGRIQSYNMLVDGPEVVADALEPNDSFGLAYDLGGRDVTVDDLSIHQGTVFTAAVTTVVQGSAQVPIANERQAIIFEPQGAATSGSFRLSINTAQTGDVQTGLIPYDADGAVVEAALIAAYGDAAFSVTGVSQGPYLVEFVGPLGSQNIIGLLDADVSNLIRSDESNDDYYKWTASDTGDLDVQILFQHVLGNVDLQVFDNFENIIGSSSSTTDNERVVVNVQAGQKYVLRVFGVNGALQSDYRLVVNGPAVGEDRFESNDSFDGAAVLGAGDQTHTGLTVHRPFNDDWFRISPAISGTLEVDILFDTAVGDLDLELYDAGRNLLDNSLSSTDNESVSWEAAEGQDYIIHVVAPIGGYTQPDYTLVINGPGPNLDAFEPNDAVDTAAELGTGDQLREDLSIHLAGNDDWYEWTAPAAGMMTVDLEFLHILGNVDLELYDADQNLLQSSSSQTDDMEHVSVAAVAGQTFFIRALGVGDALQESYSMQITGNDPPMFSDIPDQSIDEDEVDATIHYTLNDDATLVSELIVSVVSSNTDLVPNESLQLEGTGVDRTIKLTSALNQSGTTTITLSATDANGAESTESFVLTVEGDADPPTLEIDPMAAGQEDSPIALSISASSIDPDGSETVTVEITDIPAGATLSAGTSFASGSWRLTPEQLAGLTITGPEHSDLTFALTVTAVATEAIGEDTATTAGSIQVTVDAVADVPTLKGLEASGDEDTAIGLEISSTLLDSDGSETLTTVMTVPSGAVLSAGTDNQDGTWTVPGADLDGLTITPPPDDDSDFALSITSTATEMANGHSAQITTSLAVSVLPVEDAPTISDVTHQSTLEDTPTDALAFIVEDPETPGDQLTVTATSDNLVLVPEANIVVSGSGNERTVTITGAENLSGSATISLTVTDNAGLEASDSFVLDVLAVNDLPTVSDISDQFTDEETSIGPITFRIGDVESPVEALTVVATSENQNIVPDANIVIEGDGAERTMTITPAANATGGVTISVTVTDEESGVGSETFVLEVGDVFDPPTMSDIADQTVLEDTPTDELPLTVDDSDTPLDSLRLTATSDNPDLVPQTNIVFGGSGKDRTVTVTPAANASGAAEITVVLSDGEGGVAAQAFMLEVTSVNDSPEITSSDTSSVPENTTTVSTITATDVEGDTVTYSVLGGDDVGLFAINSLTGALSFVSSPDYETPGDADGDNVYLVEVGAHDGESGTGRQVLEVTVTDQIEDITAPTVQVSQLSPQWRASPVSEITIVFSEPVSGFELSDLTLSLRTDGTADVGLDSATLTSADQTTWTLGNLTGPTGGSGIYALTLAAVGSGIADAGGNGLVGDGRVSWTNGAGDANQDNQFDQTDLIRMLQSGTYLTGLLAAWGQGDFDGNGRFDQFDIILVQSTDPHHYLAGPFAAETATSPLPADSTETVDVALADDAGAENAHAAAPSVGTAAVVPPLGLLVDAALAEVDDDEDEWE